MKNTRSNINFILFAGAMITFLVLCMILGSCTRTIYKYEPVDYRYVCDPLTYVEPFREDTICDHFWVSMSVPIDSIFDPMTREIVEGFKADGGWPCVCIYCHEIKLCYN